MEYSLGIENERRAAFDLMTFTQKRLRSVTAESKLDLEKKDF